MGPGETWNYRRLGDPWGLAIRDIPASDEGPALRVCATRGLLETHGLLDLMCIGSESSPGDVIDDEKYRRLLINFMGMATVAYIEAHLQGVKLDLGTELAISSIQGGTVPIWLGNRSGEYREVTHIRPKIANAL